MVKIGNPIAPDVPFRGTRLAPAPTRAELDERELYEQSIESMQGGADSQDTDLQRLKDIIAGIETSHGPDNDKAYSQPPNKSGYEGKYQFRYRSKNDAGYAIATKLGIDPKAKKTPEQQEAIMDEYLAINSKRLRSKGIDPTPYNLWLAHNQGATGAEAILSNKLTPQIRRNIKNQAVQGSTDEELIQNYHDKFQPRFADSAQAPGGTEKITVRMPDGSYVKNVPRGSSKDQVLDIYNEQNGFTSIKGVRPGFFTRVGESMQDFATAMKLTKGGFLRPVLDAFSDTVDTFEPEYSDTGEFKGIRKLSTEEVKEQRLQRAKDLRKRYDYDPESGIALAAAMTQDVIDPVTWGLVFTKIPASGLKRVAAMMGYGGAIEASLATLQEATQKSEIDSDEVMTRALFGAVGAAGLDLIGRTAFALLSKSGGKLDFEYVLTKLEGEVAQGVDSGLSKQESLARALKDNEVTAREVRTAATKLNRKLDFSTLPYDKLTALGKVKHAVTSSLHVPHAVEKYITPVSSRLRDISEPIFGALRKVEYESHVYSANASQKIETFLNRKKIFGLKGQKAAQFDSAVSSGNSSAVQRIAQDLDQPGLYDAYLEVRKLMDGMFQDMVDAGLPIGKLTDEGIRVPTVSNFFPRIVKDYSGLKKSLGQKERNSLDRALAKAKEQAGRPLTEAERAKEINKVLQGFGPKRSMGSRPGFLKQRVLDEVSVPQLKYYDDPNTAVLKYIDSVAHSIQKQKFFGRHVMRDANKNVNIDESVGSYTLNLYEQGRLTSKELSDLQDILKARFSGGERPMGRVSGNLRNIFYLGTLGNPTSAVTQFGDLGLSSFYNGLWNTIKGLAGPRFTRVSEMNLDKRIASEFQSTGKTAQALDWVLKRTGFKFVDRLGKTANLNGSIHQAMSEVSSSRGLKEFERKWSGVFGNEYNSLVADLRKLKNGTGEVTDNIKLLAWNRLSDVQPISLSEMPEMYLKAPGGRIFYMLKTFTIKQLDLIRREAFREVASGNPRRMARGMLMLGKYGVMFGAANFSAESVKNSIRGRPTNYSDMSINLMWKNFGLSSYIVDDAVKQGPLQALGQLVAPPISLVDRPLVAAKDYVLAESMSDLNRASRAFRESSSHVPIVGQFLYDWFGGGIEHYYEKQRRKERDRVRER